TTMQGRASVTSALVQPPEEFGPRVVELNASELGAETVQPFGERLSSAEVDALERAVALTLLVTGVPEGTPRPGANLRAAERLLHPAEPRVRFAGHTGIVCTSNHDRLRVV